MIKIILNTSSKQLAHEYNHVITNFELVFKFFDVQVVHSAFDIELFTENCTFLQKNEYSELKVCIVSPGNSFGYLNGGFDKGILDLFNTTFHSEQIKENWVDFQDIFQTELKALNKTTYSPQLNPSLLDLTKYHYTYIDDKNNNINKSITFTHILHMPTMTSPERPLFNNFEAGIENPHNGSEFQEKFKLVFNCCFTSLIKLHTVFNDLDVVVIPGFGAGYGGVDNDICALAVVTAIKLFELNLLNDLDPKVLERLLLKIQFFQKLDIFSESNKFEQNIKSYQSIETLSDHIYKRSL